MQKRTEELRREARAIAAWIRDVTAEKRARLCQIRRELAGLPGVVRTGPRITGKRGNLLPVRRLQPKRQE